MENCREMQESEAALYPQQMPSQIAYSREGLFRRVGVGRRTAGEKPERARSWRWQYGLPLEQTSAAGERPRAGMRKMEQGALIFLDPGSPQGDTGVKEKIPISSTLRSERVAVKAQHSAAVSS